MSVDLQQIASRIKELRQIAGVSIETLAGGFGIPVETYRHYESGAADMPVTFLTQVADRFGVELTVLLTGDEPRLHTYALVRAGNGVAVRRHAAYDYEDLAFNFVDKSIEIFMVTVPASAEGAPVSLNSHPGQEFNHVLEGRMRVFIEERELVLEPGDSLYFDASVPHGMQALDDQPARFLAVVT